MLPRPKVQDIQTYLRDNGWEHSLTWRDAPVWSHVDGYELLVPPRDDLMDTDLRVRELLNVLAVAEQRSADDILVDIYAPLDDIQSFRTFPEGMPPGFTSLKGGIRALHCVQSMIGIAARTVVEGPLPKFAGGVPTTASDLMQRVRLGPGHPGSYVFTVRVPVDAPSQHADPGSRAQPDEPLGRQVARQFYEAITAANAATAHATLGDLAAFDNTLTAGVSADLCLALSVLAGRQYEQSFDVTFRWSHGLHAELPASTVHFADGAGKIIRAAARRLRQVRISGAAEVTGLVESLHDQPEAGDRWRIKVRGDLTTQGGTAFGRTIWVRLDGQASYDRTIAAHQARHLVWVRGELSAHGRLELVTDGTRFEVIG
ncbi:MAG: hypothetical protein ABSA53_20425 [Streptosporangiaceae bacterium]|jgi:hypothetical protein